MNLTNTIEYERERVDECLRCVNMPKKQLSGDHVQRSGVGMMVACMTPGFGACVYAGTVNKLKL
jgi:hypothetical protein